MISRRIIRVKVMQTLYALDSQDPESIRSADAVKILRKQFEQSRQLFIYMVYLITEIARYAERDARIRASKHLPNEQDKNVNIKLAGNQIVWKILDDESFKQAAKEVRPQLIIDNDLVKKLYYELSDSAEYRSYTVAEPRDRKSEKDIIEFIFTGLILPSDAFEAHIEDNFTNWDDDVEMINQLMMGYLGKPKSVDFLEIISDEKWDFAKGLLEAVIEKKETTLDLIKPKLKNWDSERIATLDMILMQMGVCEFLYFETIPPKVTINEYIDLAKEYSTPMSGQFVNGILDNIHKDLVSENKMHKVNYKAG